MRIFFSNLQPYEDIEIQSMTCLLSRIFESPFSRLHYEHNLQGVILTLKACRAARQLGHHMMRDHFVNI